jgi:hypothetical protein
MEEKMATRKRYSVEQIIAKLREVERLQGQALITPRPASAFRSPIRPFIALTARVER